MTGCLFCQKQDDPSGMRIYDTCNISNGEPCAPCVEYTSLQAEIEEMKQALENKLVRQREIREKINRQHDRMLIRMPRELLDFIFELAASLDKRSLPATSSEHLRKGEKHTPLFLGAVCRAWRDVAWNIPRLWTFINIHIPTVEALPERFEMAKQWLSRTGTHLPLSVHIRTHETFDPYDCADSEYDRLHQELMDNFEPLMKLVASYSSRWKNLCAASPPRVIPLLFQHGQSTPILQTIQLSATRRTLATLKFCWFGHSSAPPYLKCIRLHNILPSAVDVDWNRVTSLDIKSIAFDSVMPILLLAPNLANLTLSSMEGFCLRSNTQDTFKCPQLRSLHLNDVSVRQAYFFLGTLTLPALKDLSIDLQGQPAVLAILITLIRRSSCVLKSMSLGRLPQVRPGLLELIEHIGSLKNLEIREPRLACECYFLDALNVASITSLNNSNTSPLPKLRQLSYTLRPHDSVIPNYILDQISHPTWTERFPRWRKLTILREPNPTILKDPKTGLDYMMDCFGVTKRRQILALVDSGKEIFMPFRFTREAIVDSLE